MTREELAVLVAAERAAQGLPPKITGIEKCTPAAQFILMAMALDEPDQPQAAPGRRPVTSREAGR